MYPVVNDENHCSTPCFGRFLPRQPMCCARHAAAHVCEGALKKGVALRCYTSTSAATSFGTKCYASALISLQLHTVGVHSWQEGPGSGSISFLSRACVQSQKVSTALPEKMERMNYKKEAQKAQKECTASHLCMKPHLEIRGTRLPASEFCRSESEKPMR